MFKNQVEKIKTTIETKAKEVIKKNISEKTSTILQAAAVIAVAGLIFSAAGSLIPSRMNLHIYVNVK